MIVRRFVLRRETNLRQPGPRLLRFARGTEAVGVNIPGPLGGNGQMKHVSEASCFFADETPAIATGYRAGRTPTEIRS